MGQRRVGGESPYGSSGSSRWSRPARAEPRAKRPPAATSAVASRKTSRARPSLSSRQHPPTPLDPVASLTAVTETLPSTEEPRGPNAGRSDECGARAPWPSVDYRSSCSHFQPSGFSSSPRCSWSPVPSHSRSRRPLTRPPSDSPTSTVRAPRPAHRAGDPANSTPTAPSSAAAAPAAAAAASRPTTPYMWTRCRPGTPGRGARRRRSVPWSAAAPAIWSAKTAPAPRSALQRRPGPDAAGPHARVEELGVVVGAVARAVAHARSDGAAAH